MIGLEVHFILWLCKYFHDNVVKCQINFAQYLEFWTIFNSQRKEPMKNVLDENLRLIMNWEILKWKA